MACIALIANSRLNQECSIQETPHAAGVFQTVSIVVVGSQCPLCGSGPSISVPCTTCGTVKKWPTSKLKRRKNHFCSKTCYHAFLKQNPPAICRFRGGRKIKSVPLTPGKCRSCGIKAEGEYCDDACKARLEVYRMKRLDTFQKV